MLTLTIIGVTIFSVYLAAVLLRYGMLPSLSQSYYELEKEHRDLGVLFYIAMAVTVFLLIAPMVECGGGWAFLSCVGLLAVGAAPAFKDNTSLQSIIHPVGALLAAAGAIVLMIYIGLWYILPIYFVIFAAIAFITKTEECYTFWLEMVAFYSLFTGLIIHYLKLI